MNRHLPRGLAALVLAVVGLAAPVLAAPVLSLPDLSPNPDPPPPLNPTPTTDSEPPAWSEQKQNADRVHQGETLLLYAHLGDDVQLGRAILSTFESGAWVNSSPYLFFGESDAWAIFPWRSPTLPVGTAVDWRIWFNDTSGNWNATGVKSFAIAPPRNSGTGGGSTRIVCSVPAPGCTDFQISDAIANAADGELITVRDGTYANFTVDRKVLIQGENFSGAVVDGSGNPIAANILRAGLGTEISNLTIQNADFGIFGEASNLTLANLTIQNLTGPRSGVSLRGANNTSVINNTLSNLGAGIRIGVAKDLPLPANNTLLRNNISGTAARGIDLEANLNTTVQDDTITGGLGIHLRGPDIAGAPPSNLTVRNNTLNGSGIVLFANIQGSLVEANNVSGGAAIGGGETSGILLREGGNNTVRSNTVSGARFGIIVELSNGNAVHENTVTGNGEGLYLGGGVLLGGTNNTLAGNNVSFNGGFGAITVPSGVVPPSVGNRIVGNLVKNNSFHGIVLDEGSSRVRVESNRISGSGGRALESFQSPNATIADNIVTSNNLLPNLTFEAISVTRSDNTSIVNNTVADHPMWGIFAGGVFGPPPGRGYNISRNTLSGNVLGIGLALSSENTLQNNTAEGGDAGIATFIITNSAIEGNTLISNGGGLALLSSVNNAVRFNSATNTNLAGIALFNSSDNELQGNRVFDAPGMGIAVESAHPFVDPLFWGPSNSNRLLNNNATNNTVGIFLNVSENTVINSNNASFNSEDGIRLQDAPNNSVSNNIARNNSRYGIYVNRSDNVASTGDDARFNLHGIFYNQTVNNTVLNGVFNNNIEDGVKLVNTDSSLVQDNFIQFNLRGSHVTNSTSFDVFTNFYSNILCNVCPDPSRFFRIFANIIHSATFGIAVVDSTDGKTTLNDIRFAAFGLRLINASNITLEDDRITESQKTDFFFVDSDASADNVTFDSEKVVVAGLFGLTVLRDLDVRATDSSGSPVQGATVTIFNVSGGLVFNGTTDPAGRIPTQTFVQFREDDLRRSPEAPYTITVSAPGFQTTATSTDLNETTTATVPITPEVPFPFGCFKSTPGLRTASLRIQNKTFPVDVPIHDGVKSHPSNACENEFRSGAFQFNRTEFIDDFSGSGVCLVTDIYTNRQGNVERLVPLRPCLPPVPPPPPPLVNLPTVEAFQNNKTQDSSRRLTLNTSEDIVLEAAFNQTGTFTWRVDGVVEKTDAGVGSSNFAVSFNDSDIHVATLTVSNANGTSDKLQWIFNVVPLPPPPPPPPPPPTVLFSDNFSLDANNDGIPDGWIPLLGTWSLVGGQLCSVGNTGTAAIYYGASAFSGDLAASADIQLITGFGGLFERLANPGLFPSDLYGAIYAPPPFFPSDALALVEFDGFQQLTLLPVPSVLLPVQRIGGGVRGANLEGTVNGVLVGSAPLFFSPKLNTGFAGLVAIQGDVCFDNFEIKSASGSARA